MVADQAHAPPANCHNCGAPAPGKFCAQCGQNTTLHVPSAREFLHEFVGHYVALEGKLWGTLKRLLFQPGALTNDYIAGRRVRYVEPLRVYLTFSILFFFLIKLPGLPGFAGQGQTADAAREAQVAQIKSQVTAEVNAADAQASARKKSGAPPTPGDISIRNDDLLKLVADQPLLKQRIQRVLDMPQEEQTKLAAEAFFHYAPYAMFCLLPVFALYLKLLYLGSGRLYGEHFLFALHSNAFAFLMFMLVALIPWDFAQFVLWLWLLGYLPWAMRRVYRSSRLGTTLRWLILISAHFLTIVSTLFSVVMAALLV